MKNKPVKISYNGRRQGYLDLHRTAWGRFKFKVKRIFRRIVLISVIVLTGWILIRIGGYINPTTIVTKAEVIKEVPRKAPVLERIAKCESNNSHYRNGQVLVVGNTNKSVDIGKYQINNVIWGAKATEMGLNLMVEEDNEKFAEYLYETYGTEPWVWSKKCWNK